MLQCRAGGNKRRGFASTVLSAQYSTDGLDRDLGWRVAMLAGVVALASPPTLLRDGLCLPWPKSSHVLYRTVRVKFDDGTPIERTEAYPPLRR